MKSINPPTTTLILAITNSALKIGDSSGWFTRRFMGGPEWVDLTLTLLPLSIAISLIFIVVDIKRGVSPKRSQSKPRKKTQSQGKRVGRLTTHRV